jgi:diguanylate cyclase (GGDEF)-like protein
MTPGAQEISGLAAQSLLVNPRAFAGSAAILVAGLLLLLYFYRRRRYILYWAAGWALTAAAMLVAAGSYDDPQVVAFAYGMSQFLAILSALVFVVSADAYRSRPRFRRAYGIAVLPVLIWFGLAPLALGTASVFAPGHLLTGGAMAAAGVAHLGLLRQSRLLGALLCGCMLIATGGAHLWIAYNVRTPNADAVAQVMFLMTVIFILTALGMQLMTFEDMTYELRVTNRRLESAQGELRQMVTTDPLTGCRNRRYFDEVIRREVQRHRRYRIPLSIMFIDIDRFKVVNDTLGHEAGDRVLQTVAGFLIKHVREADYVFRWGGDEFLILISCHEDHALRKSDELREAFATSDEASTLPQGVGLSIGCVEVPAETDDVTALVKQADERMYTAKRRAAG